MTREVLRAAVEEVFQQALDLHAGKNKGYAYEEDGLSNFKKAAARSRQTPIQYLWTLNSKQILAVEEAIFDGKEVTFETVEDKLLDNIVYSAIALAMLRADTLPQPFEFSQEEYEYALERTGCPLEEPENFKRRNCIPIEDETQSSTFTQKAKSTLASFFSNNSSSVEAND